MGHFQYVRIIFITYGSFRICTDHFHYVQVISNMYGSFPICMDHFQYTHIIFNHLEYTQSISNTSNHFRTISFQKLPYASYLSKLFCLQIFGKQCQLVVSLPCIPHSHLPSLPSVSPLTHDSLSISFLSSTYSPHSSSSSYFIRPSHLSFRLFIRWTSCPRRARNLVIFTVRHIPGTQCLVV